MTEAGLRQSTASTPAVAPTKRSGRRPGRLARAARQVAEEIVRLLEDGSAHPLRLVRGQLEGALNRSLSCQELATVVAEAAALGWAETTGQRLDLPGPLSPLGDLLRGDLPAGVASALEALRLEAMAEPGETAGKLPDGHLYEDFLESFAPARRTERGVYYTPQPLVDFVTRATHELLTSRLGLPSGLASPGVVVVDPAAGTGAFLLSALKRAAQSSGNRGFQALGWRGFEIQPGAYVAGALRLDRWLQQDAGSGLRAHAPRLHLADVLGPESVFADSGASWENSPGSSTLVFLGNPPWSHRGEPAPWMDRLLREGYLRADGTRDHGYHRCGGEPLGVANTKWLGSDYVQMLRLGQWCLDRTGRGVLGMVLNHGFLDNFTFRGLRDSLLASFGEVLVLDLGGNARKGKGGRATDQNVFPVQQGVAVVLLVKGGPRRGAWRYGLRGSRSQKLSWLASATVETIPWERIRPRGPHFVFRSQGGEDRDYWRHPSVREIFPVGSMAVITGRDRLVVALDEPELMARLSFLREAGEEALGRGLVGLKSTRTFDAAEALRRLQQDGEWPTRIVPYLFRPGDRRVLFNAPYLVERRRHRVMRHLESPGNVALLLPRCRRQFPAAWVTDVVASHRVAARYEGTYAFPLYLGTDGQPNIEARVLDELGQRFGEVPSPEDVFGFVYGVLWSQGIHRRHEEALRCDWPRIAFPREREVFEQLALRGWDLVELHLGRRPAGQRVKLVGELPVRLPRKASAVRFDPDEERLHLGEKAHLAPVSPEAWQQRVGGYPVLAGWLKHRAGRRLGAEQVEELCRLVEMLAATATSATKLSVNEPTVPPLKGGNVETQQAQ